MNEEEFHVIQGVLDLGKKKAVKAMTALEKVTDARRQQSFGLCRMCCQTAAMEPRLAGWLAF